MLSFFPLSEPYTVQVARANIGNAKSKKEKNAPF